MTRVGTKDGLMVSTKEVIRAIEDHLKHHFCSHHVARIIMSLPVNGLTHKELEFLLKLDEGRYNTRAVWGEASALFGVKREIPKSRLSTALRLETSLFTLKRLMGASTIGFVNKEIIRPDDALNLTNPYVGQLRHSWVRCQIVLVLKKRLGEINPSNVYWLTRDVSSSREEEQSDWNLKNNAFLLVDAPK